MPEWVPFSLLLDRASLFRSEVALTAQAWAPLCNTKFFVLVIEDRRGEIEDPKEFQVYHLQCIYI